MRKRGLLTTLILTLLGGFSSGGCQLFAGLTVLQVDEGQGGAGGGATSSATSSASGSGSGSGDTGSGSGGGGIPCSMGGCPSGLSCNPVSKECHKTCKSNGDCDAQEPFCIREPHVCDKCGHEPMPPPKCPALSTSCEVCDPQNPTHCTQTCDTPGECDSPSMGPVVRADAAPATLLCGDQCNDTTVTCLGPFSCDIICNAAGCNNLTVRCDPDGPCSITCVGSGCTKVTMKCGSNLCFATCTGGNSDHLTQECGDSCSCANQSCK
jgi:hypothetical protein